MVTEDVPAWHLIYWPVHMGNTKTTGNPLDSDSPTGPAAHKQWTKPSSIVEKPEGLVAAQPELPVAPRVRAEWDGGKIRLHYETAQPSAALVVTVNSPDEREPPRTETFHVDSAQGEAVGDAE